MPLILDLMTRTQVSEYCGDFPKGGKGGSVSSVGGIGVSEAMQFLYFFFSFWSPEQPRNFFVRGTWTEPVDHSFWEPQGNAINEAKLPHLS